MEKLFHDFHPSDLQWIVDRSTFIVSRRLLSDANNITNISQCHYHWTWFTSTDQFFMIYNIKLWYRFFVCIAHTQTTLKHAKGNLSNFTTSIHPLNKRENRTPNHAYEEYAQHIFIATLDSIHSNFSIHFLAIALCVLDIKTMCKCKCQILNLNLCEWVKENLQTIRSIFHSLDSFCLLLFLSLSFHLFSCTSGDYKWIVVLDITCWQIKYGSLFMHRIEWNTTDRQQTCYVDCPL